MSKNKKYKIIVHGGEKYLLDDCPYNTRHAYTDLRYTVATRAGKTVKYMGYNYVAAKRYRTYLENKK
jgi:hypothetical protein